MFVRILLFSLLASSLSTLSMELPRNDKIKIIDITLAELDHPNIIDRIKNQPVRIHGELQELEKDLTHDNWTEIIEAIALELHNIFLPDINVLSIEQFKADMLKDKFSLANLRNALKKNFGIGHLTISRNKDNLESDLALTLLNIKENSTLDILALKFTVDLASWFYIYDPSKISLENIYNYIHNNYCQRITVELPKDTNVRVPIITVPTLSYHNRPETITFNDISNARYVEKTTMLNDMNMITGQISKKYDNIILDLRKCLGGDQHFGYYLISLLLGDNDPDMHKKSILIPWNLQRGSNYHQDLENTLNELPLEPSFYENCTFEDVFFSIKKNIDITFKKMVVLVDENTTSGGEILAATLKNTLGSKICILGKPCAGSFEVEGKSLSLPYNFTLKCPQSMCIFYSQKHKKILTGCRLLPDIKHENMDTIVDKALKLIQDPTITYPSDPSYERTIQQ